MTSQVTDVLEAVQSFIAKGYDREYRVKDGNLVDLELGSTLDACSIRVDAALRLESGDDGEDASNIYAITDPATEHKGLLIDAFDVFHEICPRDLSERLVAHRETAPAGDQDAPSKHGLRKVYKNTVYLERAANALRGHGQAVDEKSTLHELAAEYKVSAERIRQLEKNAMDKIKTAMMVN